MNISGITLDRARRVVWIILLAFGAKDWGSNPLGPANYGVRISPGFIKEFFSKLSGYLSYRDCNIENLRIIVPLGYFLFSNPSSNNRTIGGFNLYSRGGGPGPVELPRGRRLTHPLSCIFFKTCFILTVERGGIPSEISSAVKYLPSGYRRRSHRAIRIACGLRSNFLTRLSLVISTHREPYVISYGLNTSFHLLNNRMRVHMDDVHG